MDDDDARTPGAGDEPPRLGNPTRLTPRRQVPEPEDAGPDAWPEPAGVGAAVGEPVGRTGGTGAPRRPLAELLGPAFAPRSLAGGRVQLFGCSPGCLVAALFASVLATLLLNALF